MKKIVFLASLVLMLAVGSGSALADSIKGRLGVTGRIGFLLPADSDFENLKLESDAGFLGGGGFIYGITDNLAAEIDVTRSEFGTNRVDGRDEGDFGITNISLGVQYRFLIPQPKLVPYAGAGLDILVSDYKRPNGFNADVDTTVGVHICGGIDYFFMKQLALNAEIKGIVAPQVDIHAPDGSGNFDPSGVSGTVGIRFFFN
ncbi:porin family protein [Geobacter pickeringii]|uniref:Membrane protein n=1 Tax=Geobacter pickeringii TaxID=345632 RepID=A0A0B5BD34_9BACT|nr:porin family protein [Geobacter pickeringii]AJE04633.1 membrane protein [Geobacter pickeringii]